MFDIQNQMPHITQISDLPRWYCIDTHRDLFQKGDLKTSNGTMEKFSNHPSYEEHARINVVFQ